LTYSLYPPGTTFKKIEKAQDTVIVQEQMLTKEYAEYQQKLDLEKEK